MRTLPRDLRRVARRLRGGDLHIAVQVDSLDEFGRRLERSANRVTIGLVVAALIVGTAITSTVTSGWQIFGLPVLGVLGFSASTAIGLWLMFSISRSPRR